ncbi:hypothetical protein LCGC14_0347660 [marine sediment metagenome]|uniref:Uncharacterized protein n=1 Tax=marine sediment metagenome TaxID=412755 RepID=A0A0F9THH6_9ZZZZ
MAKVACTKCGEKGSSKCPFCRSIFLNNQELAYAELVVNVSETDNSVVLTVNLAKKTADGKKRPLEEMMQTLKTLSEQSPGLLCLHSFDFEKEQESSIGCGHHG